MSLFSIFIFIVILVALVVVHEAGHFLAAKALKVRVDEFAFGFPPRLFSKKIGETDYVFNALPLGGYVKIHGEEGGDGEKDPRSLASKSWWQQLIVLLAGVTMNMLFALVILIVISLGSITVSEGEPLFERATEKKLLVTDVLEGSPAAKAGLSIGDEITSLSSRENKLDVLGTEAAIAFIQKSESEITLQYKNEKGVLDTVTVAPVYGFIKDKKAVGIGLTSEGKASLTFIEGIKKGAADLAYYTMLIAHAFKHFFETLFSGGSVADQVSGPVGLAKAVHKAGEMGGSTVLLLAALISINLAFFNALPFPSLDGGRSLIVIGEAIVRRKMNKKLFTYLNAFGFIFLMVVFLVVTVKDIFY